jgi:hypothetical protein
MPTHELAGKTVKLRGSSQWDEGAEYRVEDYADNVLSGPGNPAKIMGVLMAMELGDDAKDGDLLYGKIGPFGYVAHTSQILPESLPTPATA